MTGSGASSPLGQRPLSAPNSPFRVGRKGATTCLSHFCAKITARQQRDATRRREKGEPMREIPRSYNVSHSTISRLRV